MLRLLLLWLAVTAASASGGMLAASKLALPLPFSVSAGNLQHVGSSPVGLPRSLSIDALLDGGARERVRYLSYRAPTVYFIDVVAGVLSALAVAPFLATIDKVVTEKAVDATQPTAGLMAQNLMAYVLDPLWALRQTGFLLIVLVYCSTYVVVNLITSHCELRMMSPFWFKLVGATFTNTILGLTKDRYFAAAFGNSKSPGAFPLLSVALLLVRDALTMGAGFSFPAPVASLLHSRACIKSIKAADRVAQIAVPLLTQLLVTPLHLLSLDVYYRPGKDLVDRLLYVDEILVPTLLIRMLRVLCAYGIAGVANKQLKESLRRKFVNPITPGVE